MTYKVLGLGDNVVDKYINRNIMYPGGNALNFSVYSTLLEHEAAFCGKFGTDGTATYIKSVLDELKVDHSCCRTFEGENGYAVVKLIDGDRHFITSNKGGIAKENPWNFTKEDLDYFKEFALIHTSLNSYIEQDLPRIKESGVPVSYDFSYRWDDKYLAAVCPYITIAFLSCSHLTTLERRREMQKILDLGVKVVVGTVGEEGSYVMFDGQELYEPAYLLERPVDTMGAGDAYLSAFLHTLLELSGGKLDLEKEDLETDLGRAMEAGAMFAAHICLIDGAFGHGTHILWPETFSV